MVEHKQVMYQHKIDPEAVQAAYLMLLDVVGTETFTRAEVITAIIVLLGVQYKGKVMPEDETRVFVTEMSNWLSAYFASGSVN